MVAGAAISFGLCRCAAFSAYNAVEDGLCEGFVSGVSKDGHGLFGRDLSVLYSRFAQLARMALTMNVLRAIPGNSFPRCIIGIPARPILLKAQDIGRSKPTIARVPGLGCVEMAILFGKQPFPKGV